MINSNTIQKSFIFIIHLLALQDYSYIASINVFKLNTNHQYFDSNVSTVV